MEHDGLIEDLDQQPPNQHFYGKYRGWVVDVDDPEQAGRLRLRIPEILGDYTSEWAVPSWPPGTTPEQHHLPEVGAEVWVDFEAGDVNRPIWDGLLH